MDAHIQSGRTTHVTHDHQLDLYAACDDERRRTQFTCDNQVSSVHREFDAAAGVIGIQRRLVVRDVNIASSL